MEARGAELTIKHTTLANVELLGEEFFSRYKLVCESYEACKPYITREQLEIVKNKAAEIIKNVEDHREFLKSKKQDADPNDVLVLIQVNPIDFAKQILNIALVSAQAFASNLDEMIFSKQAMTDEKKRALLAVKKEVLGYAFIAQRNLFLLQWYLYHRFPHKQKDLSRDLALQGFNTLILINKLVEIKLDNKDIILDLNRNELVSIFSAMEEDLHCYRGRLNPKTMVETLTKTNTLFDYQDAYLEARDRVDDRVDPTYTYETLLFKMDGKLTPAVRKAYWAMLGSVSKTVDSEAKRLALLANLKEIDTKNPPPNILHVIIFYEEMLFNFYTEIKSMRNTLVYLKVMLDGQEVTSLESIIAKLEQPGKNEFLGMVLDLTSIEIRFARLIEQYYLFLCELPLDHRNTKNFLHIYHNGEKSYSRGELILEAWSAVKFIYELNSTFGARAYVRNVLGLRKADEKKDYIRISEAIARADKKINAYQAILEKARQEAILFEKQEEELQLKKAEELKAQQAKYDELLRAFVAEEEKAYLDSKKKCQAKQKKTVEPKVAEIAEVAKAETVSAANQTVTLFKPAPKPSLYDQMLKETIQYYDSNNDVIKSLPVFNNNMNAIMAQASSPTDFDRVQSAAMLGDAQLRCLCHYITTNRLTEENIDEADAYYKTGVEYFEKAFALIKDWRETEKEDEKEDREECILAIKMAFEKMQKIFDKHLKDLLEQKKNDEEELNKLLKQVKTDNREHKQFRRKVIRAQGYDAWCKPKPEGYISPYQQKVITRDKRIRVLKNKIQEESIPCKKAEEILTNHQIMHNKLGELANAKQVRPIVRK